MTIFFNQDVEPLKKELERLKRELEEARQDLVGMSSEGYGRLLYAVDYQMETSDDLETWQYAAIDKIVESIDGRAPCPLCGTTVAAWGPNPERGWTRDGLYKHLTSRRGERVSRCPVFQAAWHMHFDKNAEKFRAADWREYEEIERRKTTDPMILLSPHDAPEFFNHPKYTWKRTERSPESLAHAVEQLRNAGFAIEQTNNVTAYEMIRDNWMMLADPRREYILKIHVYSGKTDKLGRTRWKKIRDFDIHGHKDWPARIEAKFQEIGSPPPPMTNNADSAELPSAVLTDMDREIATMEQHIAASPKLASGWKRRLRKLRSERAQLLRMNE